jgi:hypothetical protein
MEIFVFPELLYAGLLANLVSPRVWRWRNDPWFKGVDKMKPYRRITRLKQYIMDHYAFNLDLDTWGLTTKEREVARFRPFLDPAVIAQSNALFGYEGDKYYFDIDIRRHFGLDRYTTDVIPYWKTETVEAMDAFRFKEGYAAGAGECVSLAILYAAALFAVCRIPLRDIFLMATPLHSQNFVDLDEGLLTNNRRIVTKAMWCNGTALSAQARRALENEHVTLVAHETGHLHMVYPEATLDRAAYDRFAARLRAYLHTDLSAELLGNFLRHFGKFQCCFQLRWPRRGTPHYVGVDRAFQYEEGTSFRLTDATRANLMAELDEDEFHPSPMPNRIVLNELEDFIREQRLDLRDPADADRLRERFVSDCLNASLAIESLIRFCHVDPRLPDPAAKTFRSAGEPLALEPEMGAEGVRARLEALRGSNPVADLAFYAARDLTRSEAEPFLLACFERSPVCLAGAEGLDDDALLAALRAWPDESIYDGPGRLAQPDEVWNFRRGDGVEKALTAASILRRRHPEADLRLRVAPDRARLEWADRAEEWPSSKQLAPGLWSPPAVGGDQVSVIGGKA